VAPLPKLKSPDRAAKKVRNCVHSDVWGPAQVQSLGGSEYFVTFTDEKSAVSEANFMKKKSETLSAYKKYARKIKTEQGISIGEFYSNGAGDYLSKEFKDFLASEGTKRTISVHDTPGQNIILERLNRTLVGNARAMLLASRLPKFLWAEAISHAVQYG
jgi:hypothetical protein